MSAKLRLQDLFKRAYDPVAWPQIIQTCFPLESCDFFQSPRRFEVSAKFIKSTLQIGNLTLGNDMIALLEIEVSDQVQLNRNRVALRNFVARFIDEAATTAVLAVFHQPNKPDWRVTYAARSSGFDEETLQLTSAETAPRRYTFLVGPHEPCRTVAGRFAELEAKGTELTLADVEKAFSVERLNKEFFKTYKQHYEGFRNHLLSGDQRAQTHAVFGIDPAAKDELEVAEKPVRDFVKRLLGRIVFIHFLQKKGWMGCPAGQSTWEHGEPEFLYNVFKRSAEPSRFHSADLVPLFYGALNTPDRPNDLFEPTGSRIPYLNGGLFEPIKGLDETQLDFPATHFEALLDFFAQYNFTIDENDPEEQEVGIDPEMLGHIFENLLEDNKDKGAFYTPKAIVQYMAQQSLIYYLLSHLGESEESRAAVEYLVRIKQLGEGTPHEKYNRANARRMSDLLDAVKICDPAIGSGAFPIGLLQEIFWLKLTLNPTLNEPGTLADLKRDIIQNSIYGVDLDAGAIDIARLRFWLALIVDEEAPRALPNLDYKIMQGDSLLESFEGIDLSKLHTGADDTLISLDPQAEMDLGGDRAQQELIIQQRRADITARIESYYSETNPEVKKCVHADIDEQVRTHIERSIALIDEELDGYIDQREKMLKGELIRPAKWNEKSEAKAEREITAYKKQRAELTQKQARLAELEKNTERPFFLWHLYFQDVFTQGGFDIVVANPPYVRQEAIKDYKPKLKEAGYTCYTGTADLFVYFYERASQLLREGGALTFITSNKYYRAGYGAKLRGYLTEQFQLRELLDFGDAPVFDAIAYASILIGQKSVSKSKQQPLAAYTWKRSDRLPRIAEIMGEQSFHLEQSNLTADSWRLERPDVFALFKKLSEKGIPLGEHVEGRFYYGIKTGLNEAFVVDRETRDRLITEDPKSEEVLKPFLRGRDVKRWKANPQDLWLIFTRRGIDIDSYPAIKKHLNRYKEKLEPKPKDWKPARSGGQWPGRKEGSYEWYEVQDNIAYWKEFEEPKVIYPDIYEHQCFAYDDTGSYSVNTTYFIPGVERWMCSLLNSPTVEWFYEKISNRIRGGYLRAFSDYMKLIPIPKTTSADRDRLSALAETAASASDTDLEVIETEINQIVYRLFDLTDEEIELIEASLESTHKASPAENTDKAAVYRHLRSLATNHDYFTFNNIRDAVQPEGKTQSDKTLYDYLNQATAEGIVHDAGKGWYSALAKPLALNTEAIQPIIDTLEAKFPLLPVCCWSSAQLNPYFEHLMAIAVHFVTVEADALPSVVEHLKEAGFKVVENPRGAVLKNLTLEDGMVIVRPGSLWENYTEGPLAPWEVLLVHASQEVKWLQFIDRTEFREAVGRALSRGRVPIATLLAYLGKMKIPALDIFPENYRVSEKI